MRAGQWTGVFAGTSSGEVILELDEVDGELLGSVTLYPNDLMHPTPFAWVRIPKNVVAIDKQMPILAMNWTSGEPTQFSLVAEHYPGIAMSNVADTKWRLSSDTLYVSWTTPLGNFGLAVLSQGEPKATSKLKTLNVTTWSEFKDYASSLSSNKFIFRGQSNNQWKLRTYFHRTNRSDLRRFLTQDVNELHRQLSGLTNHFFDLTNPIQNGAFYAMVQHHGYPTPLLDWTFSPFVAAYFAYRPLPKKERTDEHKVRIVIFDAAEWRKDFVQFSHFTPAKRHFSLFAPIAINNNRLSPQQALLTISNVDDIEAYVAELEQMRSKSYLYAIDLAGSERFRVMQELSMMGITAGSMFPGLDGACEHLREQRFEF